MPRPKWGEVPGHVWASNKTLRDIYVLGTTLADWEECVQACRAYPCRYAFDRQPATLPSAAEIFADRSGYHSLHVQLGRVVVFTCFFVEEEIELSFAPEQIKTAEDQEWLLEFVELLATRVRRPAMITQEDRSDEPDLTYDPAAGAWLVRR